LLAIENEHVPVLVESQFTLAAFIVEMVNMA
jgi:hypothetical protein